jgi:thymidylate synthase ThyX
MHQSFGIVNSIKESSGNDVAKYFLPEGVVTDLILTVNLRELRHMWKVRHSEKALLEFQIIMEAIVESLPEYARELVTYSPEIVSSDSSLLSKATDLLRKASHSMEGVCSQNESGALSVNTPLIEDINEFLNTVNNLKEKGAEVSA